MTNPPLLSCAFPASAELPEYARVAEDLGYHRLWVFDSPALYGDQFVALTRVAEATDRLGVAAGVCVPFHRHPMVVASAVASLAELAPGRFAIAFGTGGSAAWLLGRQAMRWADLEQYVVQVRNLLAGDIVEIDGKRTRMVQSPGFAPRRPIDVPILVAPTGPKGFAVARRVADGVILTGLPTSSEWPTCALLCNGTVLDPGEDHSTPRVVETAGPSYATLLHVMSDRVPNVVGAFPGGAEWLAELERLPPEDRHWSVHEGHMVAVNERDRAVVAQAGPALLQSGWSGYAAAVREKALGAADAGVTELAYNPTGLDIPRELRAFAAAVSGA